MLSAFATAGALLVHAPDAHACSPVACSDGEVFPRSGEVPANALVFFVRDPVNIRSGSEQGAGLVDAYRPLLIPSGDAGTAQVLETDELGYESLKGREEPDVLLRPIEPVAAGTVLVVKTTETCSGQAKSTELRVTEAAPTPEALGELEVSTQSGPLNLWTSNGSCTQATFTMFADVSVRLAPDAEPYADILRFGLLVDGERFASDDWSTEASPGQRGIAGGALGPGNERVYAVCDTSNEDAIGAGVEAGPHKVRLIALLPDGSAIESDEQQINLTCPSDSNSDCSLGGTAGGSAQATQDSGTRSGEGDQNNALADADDSDSGCSFSAKRSTESNTDHGGLTVMLGALGLGLALRRRATARARS